MGHSISSSSADTKCIIKYCIIIFLHHRTGFSEPETDLIHATGPPLLIFCGILLFTSSSVIFVFLPCCCDTYSYNSPPDSCSPIYSVKQFSDSFIDNVLQNTIGPQIYCIWIASYPNSEIVSINNSYLYILSVSVLWCQRNGQYAWWWWWGLFSLQYCIL